MPHIEIKMYPGRSAEVKKRYCRENQRLSCKRNEYGNKILFRISKRNRERTVAGRSGGKNTKRRNVCRGQLLIGDGGFLEIPRPQLVFIPEMWISYVGRMWIECG